MTPSTYQFPLSYAQQRLWFLAQLEPGSVGYNIPAVVRMRGNLNVGALEQALQALVRRHETLRTRFVSRDGEPQQIIDADLPVHLPVVNAPEQEALEIARKQSLEPFDLETGPLMRMQLVRIASDHHLLVLTLHHIISDGWSTGVLIAEVGALYAAYASGRDPRLPELPIQYADYAVWQRQFLQGDELERQLSYWRTRLEGAPVLELMGDHARPAVWSERGAMERLELGAELSAAVERFSRERQATKFMTLLGGLAATLARYTGQAEVVIGTPIANRTRAELEGLIGFLVNTLALRVEVKREEGFGALVDRVREQALQGYAHQDVPFEKVVEELSPERDRSRTPLFQVLFTHQNARHKLGLRGMEVEAVEMQPAATKFDLELHAIEEEGGLQLGALYRTDLFDAVTIQRMLRHLRRMLQEGIAQPRRRVSDLDWLEEHERHQMLDEWNATARKVDFEAVHTRIARQATEQPRALALEFEERQVTYGELIEKARSLAGHLQRLGVGPEARVGICLERSVEMVVGVLAVLMAGGAYVPMDPDYPAERLAYLMQDARAHVMLSQRKLLARIPETDARLVCLDEGWEDAPFVEPRTAPQQLAYIIYTSGSTGKPKGVGIQHDSCCAFVDWAGTAFSPEEWAGVLASTSICFDLSVYELLATLTHGGTIVLSRNLLEWTQAPSRTPVRVVNTVPSALQSALRFRALPETVLTVNLAGEALPAALANEVYQHAGVVRVWNLYGPSEDTTYSTWHVIERGSNEAPPIGRPIANTAAYVLDDAMQPVPVGVPGELYLGGMGLARGYWNQPGLTAERFVPNPFGAGGERLYRTGDRVRWSNAGVLHYLGRRDSQVKVRGFRIEPGEIEAVLLEHPQVREAAVLARPEAAIPIVAYVVASESADWRGYLAKRLPGYMVPSAVVELAALPVTPNGKLDRAALPAPEQTGGARGSEPPRTKAEIALAAIWSSVLGRPEIYRDDDFFELGGHSLLVMQVVSRIRSEWGFEAPIRLMFEAPQLARFTAACEELLGGAAAMERAMEIAAEVQALSPAEVNARLQRKAANAIPRAAARVSPVPTE